MMSVLAWGSLLIGSVLYAKIFKNFEFRNLMTIANFISFTGGLLGVMFIWSWNEKIGIPDKVFYGIYIVIIEALAMCFIDLPGMVLIAKITPKHIEGTVFAFLTGVINMSAGVISPMVGSYVNDLFFKVKMENINDDTMV